ncbi:hypothetical protein [uncultured Pseudodesulfovibrio sp.]|uniref:hypothetical protein n=1 Tax=uncultured Pseudodesulfovibrio sp. TaxID=2035858 RepID=UPI0029C98352|nr:hypothetical protein [uncultured Pseudodesulfovibrio sp.]
MSTKPLKTMVAETYADGQAYGAGEVFELVKSHYPNEKYCSDQVVAEHLKSLKAVGIIHEDGSYLDDSGQLVSVYRISEYGQSKVQKAQ